MLGSYILTYISLDKNFYTLDIYLYSKLSIKTVVICPRVKINKRFHFVVILGDLRILSGHTLQNMYQCIYDGHMAI